MDTTLSGTASVAEACALSGEPLRQECLQLARRLALLAAASALPVSYTHLDVYKRELHLGVFGGLYR